MPSQCPATQEVGAALKVFCRGFGSISQREKHGHAVTALHHEIVQVLPRAKAGCVHELNMDPGNLLPSAISHVGSTPQYFWT